MAYFVDIPITTSAPTLTDQGIDDLRSRWEGWEPNEGDLEVILLEVFGPLFADLATMTSRVPAAIVRTIGQNLDGIPYAAGVAAGGAITVTVLPGSDPSARIQAGAEFLIDGVTFYALQDTTIGQATTLPGIAVQARVLGTVGNNLSGTDIAPLTALSFIADVTLDAPTSGGVDPDDDTAYQDRVIRARQRKAKTLCTTRDYELEAIDQGATRAVAVNDGARRVQVVSVDENGEPMGASFKAALAATYDTLREGNTIVTIADPTYAVVSAEYTAKMYGGYDPVDLVARINEALRDWLSPSTWGIPRFQGETSLDTTLWALDNVVRRNKAVDVIATVDGVDYVSSVILTAPGLSTDINGDLTLPGSIALPQVGTVTGAVS
jgi:hypothetical protein